MSKLVSVIVPFYNPPKLRFRKCIESLIQQTYSNFEIIMINDGSEDYYKIIVDEYAIKDARIRIITKENEGVSVARNLGIEIAKGEYVSFVDADDYVEPTFLETLVNSIEDADLAVCGIREQYFPIITRWENMNLFLSQPNLYNGIQYINFCANKLFDLLIIKENNICFDAEIKLGEDALFLNKYLGFCNSIRFNGELLYHYIPSPTSAVRKFQPDYWNWEQEVIEKQWDMFHKYNLTRNQELAMVAWLFHKFKGALNYYIYNLEDRIYRENKIKEIVSHPLFSEFSKYNWKKETPHFTRSNRVVLYLWCKFGAKGVVFADKIKRMKHIVRR